MIVYPINWMEVGRSITIKDIEFSIEEILSQLSCNCLALSGGLDSSLMLYFMLQRFKKVEAFTIGVSEYHPDVKYSTLVVSDLGRTKHRIYIPTQKEIDEEENQSKDLKGDKATRLFYKFVSKYTDEIISCDGIDEYMAGYYDHQENPNEETYYKYIRQLREKHLEPLNRNSDQVKIYLPYLDSKLLCLLSQIPIAKKVTFEQRKTLIIAMAENKIPSEIINRRKYGFCDALRIRD